MSQIGSITKTMIATVVLRLVEQGRLDLDRPVRAILPELQLADKASAANLTLRHLLTHTGGWATGRANYAAGGVVTNIPNLLRYARFHLREGVTEDGQRLLQPTSLAEMRRPQAWPGFRPTRWA